MPQSDCRHVGSIIIYRDILTVGFDTSFAENVALESKHLTVRHTLEDQRSLMGFYSSYSEHRHDLIVYLYIVQSLSNDHTRTPHGSRLHRYDLRKGLLTSLSIAAVAARNRTRRSEERNIGLSTQGWPLVQGRVIRTASR